MNRGRSQTGYTIVETLIFLAVTGALFISAMGLISGKQGRTEFSQATREFEIELQNIANDVSTGYYTNPSIGGEFIRCTAGVTGVTISKSPGDNQGSNKECIFIGRTLHLNVNSNSGQYKFLTLVGKRQSSPGVDVSSYDQSRVKAIAPSTSASTTPDVSDVKQSNAFEFGCAMYSDVVLTPAGDKPCTGSPVAPATTSDLKKIDHLTFMTTFVGLNAYGNRESGDTRVDLLVRSSSSVVANGRATTAVAEELNKFGNGNLADQPKSNPAGGIFICLNSTGSNQFALVRIGGKGSQFSTDTVISTGRCS